MSSYIELRRLDELDQAMPRKWPGGIKHFATVLFRKFANWDTGDNICASVPTMAAAANISLRTAERYADRMEKAGSLVAYGWASFPGPSGIKIRTKVRRLVVPGLFGEPANSGGLDVPNETANSGGLDNRNRHFGKSKPPLYVVETANSGGETSLKPIDKPSKQASEPAGLDADAMEGGGTPSRPSDPAIELDRDGNPCVGAFMLDYTFTEALAAARMHESAVANWRPVIAWLQAGIEPATIKAAIQRSASRSNYNPRSVRSLAYFTGAVHEEPAVTTGSNTDTAGKPRMVCGIDGWQPVPPPRREPTPMAGLDGWTNAPRRKRDDEAVAVSWATLDRPGGVYRVSPDRERDPHEGWFGP